MTKLSQERRTEITERILNECCDKALEKGDTKNALEYLKQIKKLEDQIDWYQRKLYHIPEGCQEEYAIININEVFV